MTKLVWVGFALLIIVVGCTPTSKITSSWKAENVHPKDYNKILVLGLMNVADRTIREKMEEHLAEDLKTLGYNAVCACEEFDPKAFNNMTEEAAINKLKNQGIGAVFTVVLLDKQKERKYVPGNIHYWPYADYYNRGDMEVPYITAYTSRVIIFPIPSIFGKAICMIWLHKN